MMMAVCFNKSKTVDRDVCGDISLDHHWLICQSIGRTSPLLLLLLPLC
jgi:hypothetical protein